MNIVTPTPPGQLANFRDVGGLPTTDGGQARAGVLWRSDAPHPEDRPPAAAPSWPPTTVVDLRSPTERDAVHPLASSARRLVNVPLSAAARPEELAVSQVSLRALYLTILRSTGQAIAEAVRHLARADGPTLIHCAAGKDRTGLVVATALSAVGVTRAAIESDYHATEPNMDLVLERHARDPAQADAISRLLTDRPELREAPPSAIRAAIDHVTEEGDAGAWLLGQGLERRDLERLRSRLIEQP